MRSRSECHILRTMSERPTSEVDDLAKRGEDVYERAILPRLGPGDQGKAVAIEVETGDYEIDKNEVVAAHRLREPTPPPCSGS